MDVSKVITQIPQTIKNDIIPNNIMEPVLDVRRITNPQQPDELQVMPITINAMVRPLLSTGQPIESLMLGEADTYVERLADGKQVTWALSHSKAFPRFINMHFNGAQYVSNEDTFKRQLAAMQDCTSDIIPPPFPYQRFVYEYMRFGTPNRGILLEHGLGSGKTRTVIMIAESFRAQGLDTVILTPAFLATNFIDEIYRWVPELKRQPAKLRRFYHFISYNAGGSSKGKGSVFEQLARLGIGFPDGSVPDDLQYIREHYKGLQPPINKLIVIEEAHGLNRSFSGVNSQLRRHLYKLLMMAHDCKVVMMSGTPVISNPFEMASIYNILRGPMQGRYTAFPLKEAEFIENYLDYVNYRVSDQDGFRRRIVGLGSYFKGITEDTTGRIYPRRGFANEKDEIVQLEMSRYQSFYHDLARYRELEKEKMAAPKKEAALAAVPGAGAASDVSEAYKKINFSSSYRSASRKASNFVFPEGTLPIKSGVVKGADPKEVKEEYRRGYQTLLEQNGVRGYFNLNEQGLKKYSIKMYTIYKTITSSIELGAPHLVIRGGAEEAMPSATSDLCACPEMCIAEGLDQPLPDVVEEADTEEPGEEEIEPIKAARVHDPDDPLMNKSPEGAKFRDVFLSNNDLDRKYGAGLWTIKGGPALVYSFYNKVEGVGIFSKVLDSHGFTEYDNSDPSVDISTIERGRRYAFIKGGMTPIKKRAIMRVFNSRENMHGQLIQVIFVTLAAAEGISLFQLRQVHIMEPFWDNVTIRQVIGRAMRLRSHFYLPEDERSVFVQRYVATRSETDRRGRMEGTLSVEESYISGVMGIKSGTGDFRKSEMDISTRIMETMRHKGEEFTTDQNIMKIADIKDRFQDDLLLQRRSAAVDCTVNRGHRSKDDRMECFAFPDEQGRAFTINATQDKGTPLSTRVIEKKAKVTEVKSGDTVLGLHFSEHRNIIVPGPSSRLRFEHAIPVYERPHDYARGKLINPANLLLMAYLVKVNGKDKLLHLRNKSGELTGIVEEKL
jgi:hypothetical protein